MTSLSVLEGLFALCNGTWLTEPGVLPVRTADPVGEAFLVTALAAVLCGVQTGK